MRARQLERRNLAQFSTQLGWIGPVHVPDWVAGLAFQMCSPLIIVVIPSNTV